MSQPIYRLRSTLQLALVLFALVGYLPAQASERVALVIGNGEYRYAPALPNPVNDANDVGDVLERMGFAVTVIVNSEQSQLRGGLRAFARAAATARIALIFYAGHGIEVEKRNFLIPVEARLTYDLDVEYEAVPLDLALQTVERARELGLILVDACRDNPFVTAMQRSGNATRSVGRGLARANPASNTLLVYATREGSIADDGSGRNSPFTSALLSHLETPGLEVSGLFRRVRDTVVAATGGQQEPFVYGSLSSDEHYLLAPPAPPPAILTPAQISEVEILFWQSVKDSTNSDDFEAYLHEYPAGRFARLARNRLDELAAAPSSSRVQPELSDFSHEIVFWDSVKDSDDPDDLEAYIQEYPEGRFVRLARNRLGSLTSRPREADPTTQDSASGGGASQAEAVFWQNIRDSDNPELFRVYLDTYPNGSFARLARAKISALQPRSSEPEQVPLAPVPDSSTSLAELEQAEQSLELNRQQRREIQRALAVHGHYDERRIDGFFDQRTRDAISAWQQDNQLTVSGYLNASQLEQLHSRARTLYQERANQTEDELELSQSERLDVELALLANGVDPGAVDGFFDQGTREALLAWQRTLGGEWPSGYLSLEQLRELSGQALRIKMEARDGEIALAISPEQRLSIQAALAGFGYYTGPADGVFNDGTRAAISRWQDEHSALASGYLQADQLSILLDEGSYQLLLTGTAYRELRSWAHGGAVRQIAFSPNGRKVLTGSLDKTARLFDVVSGQLLHSWQHDERLWAPVAFSADGQLVLTGSNDDTARLFEADSGAQLHSWEHDGNVYAVAFSPNGQLVLTGSEDHQARLFEVSTGRQIHSWNHGGNVVALAFSPDGQLVLTGSWDQNARLFDISGQHQVHFWPHAGTVNAVAFSPDGRLALTGSRDNNARLFETGSGDQLREWTHDGWVGAIAFSPDGRKVATGSFDKTARLFDTTQGTELARWEHDHVVESVAFSPDGRLVLTGSGDKSARLFDVATGQEVHRWYHGSGVASVAFSPDGRLVLTGSGDNMARLFLLPFP